MKETLGNIKKSHFAKLLVKKISLPFLLIGLITVFYLYAMSFINHQNYVFVYVIVTLAFVKTIILAYSTIKQLTKLVKNCHSFNQLLWIFGVLIGLSIFSFATDYTCLFEFNNLSFSGMIPGESYLSTLFHFFYFSITTFSTIGFGDIAPISDSARLIVMLEIFISFLIIVFALSNISKMHVNEKS